MDFDFRKRMISKANKTMKKEKSLLNKRYLKDIILKNSSYSESHGANGKDYLGTGILYYSFTHLLKAKTAVCLGSGGGFVPRLMRQAQRDLGIEKKSKTILIDANLPSSGYGFPDYLDEKSFFRKIYSDVKMIVETTEEASSYFKKNKVGIDYLHIDADHSFKGVMSDYEIYRPFMSDNFMITIHDSGEYKGVKRAIDKIRLKKDVEVLDFDYLWAGLAIIKPKNAPKKYILKKSFSGLEKIDREIDRNLGKLGIFLNKRFPELYRLLCKLIK